MTRDPRARIVGVERWGNYRLIEIDTPAIAREARPGQFLMIKVSGGTAPLLRRPISIHAREGDRLGIFFQVAGKGTEILAAREEDELLDIIGPLGKGFTLDARLKGEHVLCIGGGRGIAPVYFLAQELRALGAETAVLYGGRTAGDIPLHPKFERAGFALLCATDDGSFGFPGLVTALAEKEIGRDRPAFLYACGPDAMMKAASGLAAAHGIPAEFSLESLMGCGFGACWGCVKRIRDERGEGWVKICEDGPVFARQRVVWEEGDR